MVSHVTAVDYTVDFTGKKVTCNTITSTEQQGFAVVAAGMLLSASLPKTKQKKYLLAVL